MTIFSIFVAPDDAEPRAVPDRFSWFATLLPPLYAIVHGLWLELCAYIVAVAALVFASLWIGDEAAFLVYVIFALLIGFEAGTLRRLALVRKRFAYRGERIAENEDGAAIGWLGRAK